MDELTREFFVESQECLDRMERCLTELEAAPGDEVLLGEIFRAVHTIKGATGFLALPRMEGLAHAGEHLLELLRARKLGATTEVVDGLLELLDGLRRIVLSVEVKGEEGEGEGELIARLEALCDRRVVVRRAEERLEKRALVVEATLRVDVSTLNEMMNQVGELVLTRNRMMQLREGGEEFQGLLRRLDAVTAELQDSVMRARTQPVRWLFQKFPRLVRDVAQQCGKRVRVEFEGEETRLDKTLLEALKDPLTHAIRNAIDHGLETPEERVRKGKEAEGVVRLSAFHEGGMVVVEVFDDGAGIDVERVMRAAVSRGVITEERGAAMSEAAAAELIFHPGFSTRDEVTSLSGRGVGMDVVRANVESVGGAVSVETKVGECVVVRMRVPLTLAILPALIVRCGGRCFAIPRSVVSELVDVPRAGGVDEGNRLWWRGEWVPLVVLGDLLGTEKHDANGYYVAVVEAKGKRFGLVMDTLLDPQEIVVKPVSRLLRMSGVFSGASILGSGEVAMILDVAGIVVQADSLMEAA